jgi:hypothetical protein
MLNLLYNKVGLPSMTFSFFFIVSYSGRDASHPEVCFIILYTAIYSGPVHATVREAGFDLGTAA